MRDIIINKILIPSLQMLYDVDYSNIYNKVSERNLCARLAHHMENCMQRYDMINKKEVFLGYYADVEYDKMNDGDPKQYETAQHRPKRMISDLLIHSRGVPQNFLALEMKHKKNYSKRREDRERIKAMVTPRPEGSTLQYVYDTLVGAFVIYSPDGVKIEIYENVNGRGEETDKKFFYFRDGRLTL